MKPFAVLCLTLTLLAGVVLAIVGFTQDPWIVWEIIGGAILIVLVVVVVALFLIDGKKSKAGQR